MGFILRISEISCHNILNVHREEEKYYGSDLIEISSLFCRIKLYDRKRVIMLPILTKFCHCLQHCNLDPIFMKKVSFQCHLQQSEYILFLYFLQLYDGPAYVVNVYYNLVFKSKCWV